MKLLILEACLVIALGQINTEHSEVGDTVDVSPDDARTLTRMGRALYLEKGDDHTKGQLTASKEDIASGKSRAGAIRRERDERAAQAAAQSPVGMAEMIAASVAAAVQAALAPAVEAKSGT